MTLRQTQPRTSISWEPFVRRGQMTA